MVGGQGPFNAYTDVPTLSATAPGIPITAALVGGNTVLTAAVAAQATALVVADSSNFKPGLPIWILDGPQSEIVLADPTTPTPDGTHVTIQSPGVQFAHQAQTSVSSAGTRGAIAQKILEASGWVENYCQHGLTGARSLFSAARTERQRMPTSRAKLDPYYTLVVRPRHFPISAVSAISIEFSPGDSIVLDPTQIELDSPLRSFALPFLATLPMQSAASLFGPPLSRQDQAWCVYTYTAGLAWPALPWDFLQAVHLAVQEFVGYLQNPTGAAELRQGNTMILQRQRGSGGKESSINGIFLSQATVMLEAYRSQFV